MKKTNKFLSIFLCLALIMSIIPMGYISASAETSTSSGRDGKSEETAFLISTVQDLEALWYLVSTGNHFEGTFFKQTADIEVNNFLPIGDSNNRFNGTYDGGNHSINGTIGSEIKEYQALFGAVGENGTIKNVINNADVKGADVVGGIVADNYGTIKNCHNKGAVEGANGIGGISGYNDGTITNCYNTGAVTGTSDYVGGVVGSNEGGIENCFNIGTIKGEDFIGGVAGQDLGGIIENCYNAGTVEGTDDFGGVVGSNFYSTIENCYFLTTPETRWGEGVPFALDGRFDRTLQATVYGRKSNLLDALNAWVSDNNDEDKYLEWVTFGGYPILRPFEGDGTELSPYQISTEADLINLAQIVNNGGDCTNLYFKQTADIEVTNFVPIGCYYNHAYQYFNGTYDGDSNEINGTIGNKNERWQALFGAVGENGTIKNVINNANVTGEKYVGGIAGSNDGGEITNCYNTGAVKGKNSVGGIAGSNDGGEITNCYNIGDIECADEYAGGVTGYNSMGVITNCFNTGDVTGEKNVGGVAGKNFYGAVLNCYYDSEKCSATGGDAAGKTTLEMSTQDFVDLLNGEDGTAFSFKDDVDYIYYPYLTSLGEDSAIVSKEKVEYEITEGDNQKVEIGTDGTLAFTCDGDFDKFVDLYFVNTLVDKSNYSAVKGSTKITLNADYVKTLPLGKQTFTLEFVDGYSVVNLEVTKGTPEYTIPTNLTATYGDTLADVTLPNGFTFDDVATTPVGNVGNNTFKVTFTPDDEVNYNKVENLEVTIKVEKAEEDKNPVVDDKPTTDDKEPTVDDTENPKTDTNSNFAFISILALISVAGAYGVKKKLSK